MEEVTSEKINSDKEISHIKRSWLEMNGSGKRPIGETTLEDKIAQRSVAMV
jgi:hypothetical protein